MTPVSATLRTLHGRWDAEFTQLTGGARARLVLCAPFISSAAVDLVLRHRRGAPALRSHPTILTNLNPDALSRGATDPRAIQRLCLGLGGQSIVHLPSLHAKVYIANFSRAVVTSGNLTEGGVRRNHEYGVLIHDASIVPDIERDILSLASLGSEITAAELAHFALLADDARAAAKAAESSASAKARSRLRTALNKAADELIRTRLRRGPIHRVFAQTIRHLLTAHGPMSTAQIHAAVQAMHPDLCDDTIDRVIDGQRFGKKWKHAVRTSQQQLKKTGEIELVDGVWRLVVGA